MHENRQWPAERTRIERGVCDLDLHGLDPGDLPKSCGLRRRQLGAYRPKRRSSTRYRLHRRTGARKLKIESKVRILTAERLGPPRHHLAHIVVAHDTDPAILSKVSGRTWDNQR